MAAQPALDPFVRAYLKRAAGPDSYHQFPIWFHPEVLDAYRDDPQVSAYRTASAGRLVATGRFRLDFGISPGGGAIHIAVSALAQLPDAERTRWLECLWMPGVSAKFAQMQLAAGSCFDDGPIRPYFEEV
ncbi:MAG: hypothetical protein ACYCO4_00845 [Sulfobacillus sp.]